MWRNGSIAAVALAAAHGQAVLFIQQPFHAGSFAVGGADALHHAITHENDLRTLRTADLTVAQMGAYVHDLDALRQVVPHAQALVAEANKMPISCFECGALTVALRNACNLLVLARDLGWAV